MTITTAPSDLFETQKQCIDAASNAIKDYRSTMEKVVESWLKNELGTIEQLAEAIGRSPKTLKTDYISSLRKQGRLPQARTGSATHKSSRSSRKKKVAGNPASPEENSEPGIKKVQVVVEEPTPKPTATPSAPQPTQAPTPEPTPELTPPTSVPSAGSSAPKQWANDADLEGWNGTLGEKGGVAERIYKREVKSSRFRMEVANRLAEIKGVLQKTMDAAQRNHKEERGKLLEVRVKMVEATLQREERPGINDSLLAVMREAERIYKFASETRRLLQLAKTDS